MTAPVVRLLEDTSPLLAATGYRMWALLSRSSASLADALDVHRVAWKLRHQADRLVRRAERLEGGGS